MGPKWGILAFFSPRGAKGACGATGTVPRSPFVFPPSGRACGFATILSSFAYRHWPGAPCDGISPADGNLAGGSAVRVTQVLPKRRRTRTLPGNVVNLGNAPSLTIPGEALPNIGFYLKRKMHAEHTLLLGLTNDAFGYLLTKVDYAGFDRHDDLSRVSLGEILIEKALDFVDSCPRPTE